MIRRAVAVAVLCAAAGGALAADVKPPPPEKLLETSTDIFGAPIRYPAGTAHVTSYMLTMVPGQKTGWHRHDVPLYAHIMSGAIEVDYGDGADRNFPDTESLMRIEHRLVQIKPVLDRRGFRFGRG